MGAFLWEYCFYGLWWICVLANGFFLYQLCRPFAELRKGRLWQALLLLTLAGSSGMVIWVGDPNLLYTLPVYILLFLLSTKGDWTGRLSVCIIFFCLEMSVCALLDTYVVVPDSYRLYDLLVRLLRTAIFGILWLVLRRRFPEEQVHLSRRLWQVVLGLAAMPLCALVAVVLLTFQKYESAAVNTLAMNQGLVVLPFVLLTSIVLLSAVLILADHERLERASQLAGLLRGLLPGPAATGAPGADFAPRSPKPPDSYFRSTKKERYPRSNWIPGADGQFPGPTREQAIL